MSQAYEELYVYAMQRNADAFLLQHVVDAFAAQTATPETKSIRIVFALVGLYLHVEKQFSGKRVQRVHMKLATQKRQWPPIVFPVDCGAVTVDDVLTTEPGPKRDRAITEWCKSVWAAYRENRPIIAELVRDFAPE